MDDGRPGAGPRYAERLWPTPGVWAAAVVFAAGIGVVCLPLGAGPAFVAAVVTAVTVGVVLVRTSPPVEVHGDRFVAGRAQVPLHLLGTVEPLEGDRMRQARGPQLDARAYLCLRGWVPGGVRVQLTDPADPAPYWIVSSRHPGELAAAIAAARQSAS